jgi:hypothetical protein
MRLPNHRGKFPQASRGTSLVAHWWQAAPEVKIMRKRYRVLLLAFVAAAVAVPLGFALSLESPATAIVSPAPSSDIGDMSIVAASRARPQLALVQTTSPGRPSGPALPDGAKLLFVGSALFGLAGVMRRAN